MNGKPLPPLPLRILEDVEKVERYAKDGLAACVAEPYFNVPKAVRLLSTCSVEALDLKATHYISLSDCCEYWMDVIGFQTTEIFLSLLPHLEVSEVVSIELEYELRQVLDLRLKHWRASLSQIVALDAKPDLAPAKIARKIREPNPELLSNRDSVDKQTAALALGKTTRTIDRLVEDKKLTAIGGSGRKRFKSKDLGSVLIDRC